MEKEIKQLEICELNNFEFDDVYEEEAVSLLRNLFEKAARQGAKQGLNKIKLSYDYESLKLIFVGHRKETDEEFLKRTDVYKWQEEKRRKQQYADYVRLKKIFEPFDNK